jgi:hypothetical protein
MVHNLLQQVLVEHLQLKVVGEVVVMLVQVVLHTLKITHL